MGCPVAIDSAGAVGQRMHAIHNARVQWLATAPNNLGLAFIVTGFVAPGVTGQLHGGWHALVTLAWVVTGVVLQGAAYFALGSLRQP